MSSLFKRSPSKVWWASESLEWREASDSPGSQDSGFSDTDVSPPVTAIFKEASPNPENLTANCREKTTPEKRCRFAKNSPKVSRNLFSSARKAKGISPPKAAADQYANTEPATRSDCRKTTSLPSTPTVRGDVFNRSAPAVLDADEGSLSGNHSLSSDCESELECLFNGALESPKHTSTPKAAGMGRAGWLGRTSLRCQRRKIECLPEPLQNEAVRTWMDEVKVHYEQECMTTLQSKSIASELHQKVAQMAAHIFDSLKNIISHSECIEVEYRTLNSETRHLGPLAQSLLGNISDFIKSFPSASNQKVSKHCDVVRKCSSEDLPDRIRQLFRHWEAVLHEVITKEVKNLTDKLENPCSELELRATTTGITSLCLRNERLIDYFTKNDVIPILLILCEKCEGSSLRSLLLRALSTMCCSASAVRQFEKYSGIQIVSDTLADETRPEPERSEAVALLAQVTAPWIEDNHCINGLTDFSRRLVKSLTRFASATKCCQNLLLCAAALANLSTMDAKCVKYVLHQNSAEVLLEAADKRGPCASVYLLEQVATLLANMTALDSARQQLTKTIPALLCFLKIRNVGEDAEKRLQQKAIIALSRLCSRVEAAQQVVELGGVEKLVRMCREKDERFCSDAVLVATLATLRKIADACGKEVISSEDAQELVEPKLLDSFLAYSAQSESYV